MKYRLSLFILLLAISFSPLRAQDGTFTASVDKNRVAMGEQFELTLTLSGSTSGSNFSPPSLNDFITLSGPNQSTNMQFINGSMSSSVAYGYVLQPRAEGKFTIGPASIIYNKKQLQTRPITIEVTKGSPQQSQRGQSQQNAQQADIGKQIGDNLFLRVTVDRAKVYQGEQITATYKIYTRVNVVNYGVSKVPSLTGFWNEDLDVPKQIQLTNETVGGKQYRVGVLKKVALFPQRSGTVEIDPMEVECVVQVQSRRSRSNDLFDQFFNDPFFGGVSNVNYKVRSEPLKVTVLPLPVNAPKGFTGAVGKFTMETWLDKRDVKTNDPVTLRIKIAGRGNIKLVEAPSVNIPPDLDRYDPKISDNIDRQGDRIAGSRTFEFLLIPRHPGDQKIPSFPFSYFDIEKKGYATLNSPEFSIAVERGNELEPSAATGISKEDVKLLGEDIRFIKSGDPSLRRKGETFFGSPEFFVLSVSPFAAFIGFFLFVRKRERMMSDVALVKNRRARKLAQRQLSQAKRFLEGNKKEEFYAEVSRALWGYIGNKLNIPPADLSTEVMQQSLAAHQVSEEVIQKLTATVHQSEFARFAPSADSLQMDTVYNGAVELISTVEDQLR